MSPLHLLCVVAGLLIFGALGFFIGHACGVAAVTRIEVRVRLTAPQDDSGEEWKRG